MTMFLTRTTCLKLFGSNVNGRYWESGVAARQFRSLKSICLNGRHIRFLKYAITEAPIGATSLAVPRLRLGAQGCACGRKSPLHIVGSWNIRRFSSRIGKARRFGAEEML